MFRKKIPFGRIILPFFSAKVQNLAVFSFIYMIRIRFFGAAGINSEIFSARTVTHHLISARCCRMLRELISGQGNNRVGHSHARNVKQESGVKEASKYIFSSAVGKAFAKRKQRHVWKPRQGMQGSERVKKMAVLVLSKRILSVGPRCSWARAALQPTSTVVSLRKPTGTGAGTISTRNHRRQSQSSRHQTCQHEHQQDQRSFSVNSQCRYQHN